jgi:hypothetical protein
LHRIVVAYVNYDEPATPMYAESSYGYAGGPSGAVSLTFMDSQSDLAEHRWMTFSSGNAMVWSGLVTSSPVTVSCSSGSLLTETQGSCSVAYSGVTSVRESRVADLKLNEDIQGSCRYTSVVAGLGYGGTATGGASGAYYQPAFVRSISGAYPFVDHQALVLLGTDGNLYANSRSSPGGTPGAWSGFTGLPTPNYGGSNVIELQFPTFTGNTTIEGTLELLFTGKTQQNDVCTPYPNCSIWPYCV